MQMIKCEWIYSVQKNIHSDTWREAALSWMKLRIASGILFHALNLSHHISDYKTGVKKPRANEVRESSSCECMSQKCDLPSVSKTLNSTWFLYACISVCWWEKIKVASEKNSIGHQRAIMHVWKQQHIRMQSREKTFLSQLEDRFSSSSPHCKPPLEITQIEKRGTLRRVNILHRNLMELHTPDMGQTPWPLCACDWRNALDIENRVRLRRKCNSEWPFSSDDQVFSVRWVRAETRQGKMKYLWGLLSFYNARCFHWLAPCNHALWKYLVLWRSSACAIPYIGVCVLPVCVHEALHQQKRVKILIAVFSEIHWKSTAHNVLGDLDLE
jgi:hypothetical protein